MDETDQDMNRIRCTVPESRSLSRRARMPCCCRDSSDRNRLLRRNCSPQSVLHSCGLCCSRSEPVWEGMRSSWCWLVVLSEKVDDDCEYESEADCCYNP